MAVITAAQQAETQKKIDKVNSDIQAAVDKIDTLQQCYEDAAATAQKFEADRSLGNENVPWAATINNRRNAFAYIYSEPLQTIMGGQGPGTFIDVTNTVSNVNIRGASSNAIEGFARNIRYDQIFNDHQHFIKGPANSLSNLLTEAQTNLQTFNVVNYQDNLTNAKRLIVNQMIEPVRIFIQSLKVVDEVITDSQSSFYKNISAYGTAATFDPETISNFDMGSEMDSLREQAGEIFTKLRDLFNVLDSLSKVKEDILKRVVLSNQGFREDPNEPGTFNKGTEGKENWGIKFSYTKRFSANEFIRTTGQNEALNNSLTQTRTRDSNKQQVLNNRIIRANRELVEDVNLEQERHYYMSLLPAIKSNLPVQGSVDVPGAMPGLQFRIENTIVKHKVPGFAPIYQPLGIDCIKCTIVGMFTGEDGVDFSDTLLKDLSQGLLEENTTLRPAKGGVSTTARAGVNSNPFLNGGALDYRNNPLVFRTGVDTPIPGNEKQQPNRAVLSEDAFSNAQEFYNEIVSPGVEINVEINTKGRSGGKTGGAAGPFRDSETGNPFFKALVKRMDIYYVRQDRCYFILDLLITNSGLIGDECINLTNIIEEATELFEEVEETRPGLDIEELEDCFKGKKDRIYSSRGKDADGSKFRVNLEDGFSYKYNPSRGTLLPDRNYPLEPADTVQELLSAVQTKKFNKDAFAYFKDAQSILLNASTGIRNSEKVDDFSPHRIFISYENEFKEAAFNLSKGTWVLFEKARPMIRNGSRVELSYKEGIKNFPLSILTPDSTSNLISLIRQINSVANYSSNSPCGNLIKDKQRELSETQTPSETTLIDVDSIQLKTLDDINNNSNTSISNETSADRPTTSPGTSDTPELRDILSRTDAKDIQSLKDGKDDKWLTQGINDYLSLISKAEDAPPLSNNSPLLTDVINTTKNNSTFFSEETGKIKDLEVLSVNIDGTVGGPGTGSLERDELAAITSVSVQVRARVNGAQDFIVKSGNDSLAYPGTTPTIFDIKLALYNKDASEQVFENNTGMYKFKSITIRTPNYSVEPVSTEEVPTAPANASPGDTNTPAKP